MRESPARGAVRGPQSAWQGRPVSQSFDFSRPDLFTAGTIGPPGQRVFYLQAREGDELLTLKCEKEQVRVLGEYLAKLLERLSTPATAPGADLALIEPVTPAWVVGSIGVIVQQPNFHRLLEEKGVDYEMITAGRFKRTLTLFGENTDEGRQKLKQELEDVHALFKAQVSAARPQVDLERVATGEHWYGTQALELKLVDELRTSDDFLLEAAAERDLYHVAYKRRRPLTERVLGGVDALLGRGTP